MQVAHGAASVERQSSLAPPPAQSPRPPHTEPCPPLTRVEEVHQQLLQRAHVLHAAEAERVEQLEGGQGGVHRAADRDHLLAIVNPVWRRERGGEGEEEELRHLFVFICPST